MAVVDGSGGRWEDSGRVMEGLLLGHSSRSPVWSGLVSSRLVSLTLYVLCTAIDRTSTG